MPAAATRARGESVEAAAARRLEEEMGLSCDLKKVHEFTYRVEFLNGLVEHEYDHVFVGVTEEEPVLNPEEADGWCLIAPDELVRDLGERPERYTYWLAASFPDVLSSARDSSRLVYSS